MYEPIFNSVLVQIDDKDAQWGTGNDDSMLGKVYSKGTVIRIGDLIQEAKYPLPMDVFSALKEDLNNLYGKQVLWNEGVEAGTLFEFDDKLFGFIYWSDIRGVLVNPEIEQQ